MSDLPTGWTETTLGEINTYVSKSINPLKFENETFELYSVPSFPSNKPEILKGNAIGSSKQVVEPNDVLVCKINPRINRVWLVKPANKYKQIASSEWIIVRVPECDSGYLRYYFASPAIRDRIVLDVTGVGGSLTRAQPKRVAKFPVPIAPLDEQKRITEKLDTLLTRVDSCQTHLERVPQILKRFRQSVLAAATSGRLTEDWREEKGDNDKQEASSDEIPAGWYWAPISELLTNHDNKRIPIRLQDRAKRRGKYPYYGAFGIIDSIDEFLYDGEYLLVAEDGKNLEKRDRPIALIASGQFWVNNHAHVLQTLNNLLLKYLCFWFNSPTLDLADYLTGIDQVKLTRGALDRISVPVPPLEEQAEIVRRVEKLFAYAERLEARYTSASEHVERLTPSLLAKTFRGELVRQEHG